MILVLHYMQISELVQKLHESYVQFTNDHEHGPQTIGGGTYAKKMPNCVAFGCEFPGKNHHMHEENELISLDDLLTAAAIYAQSLYNLLKKQLNSMCNSSIILVAQSCGRGGMVDTQV